MSVNKSEWEDFLNEASGEVIAFGASQAIGKWLRSVNELSKIQTWRKATGLSFSFTAEKFEVSSDELNVGIDAGVNFARDSYAEFGETWATKTFFDSLKVTSIGERGGNSEVQELINFHIAGLLLMLNIIVQENEENEATKSFYSKEIFNICNSSLGIAEETVKESYSSVKTLYFGHKDELDDMHPG